MHNPTYPRHDIVRRPTFIHSHNLKYASRSSDRARGEALCWQEHDAQQLDRRLIQSWLVASLRQLATIDMGADIVTLQAISRTLYPSRQHFVHELDI